MERTVLFIGLLFCAVSNVWAQDEGEYPRRFAIDGQIGATVSPKGKTDIVEEPIYHYGYPKGQTSALLSKFHVECYLPQTHFSLKAGYEHEELGFMKNDISYDMHQLMAGGRYYPAPNEWLVQPYGGVDVLWNCNSSCNRMVSSMTSISANGERYERSGIAKAPHFSIGPVVGADIYLFTCIALQLEYGYRWGLGSYVDVSSKYNGDKNIYHTHTHMNRHVLTMGLKVTFPFTFTSRDGMGLVEFLGDALFGIY
ncbi:MAG: hypothetical protein PUH24_00040 [Prevotellaceae bacterium]|nr:hypothetical protein [Prevotella sp.]MDD7256680.1 hypothetical protein [Prevotellaceae bacterium]MDY6131549.1 hypothetical protein [Prevotella sp.]